MRACSWWGLKMPAPAAAVPAPAHHPASAVGVGGGAAAGVGENAAARVQGGGEPQARQGTSGGAWSAAPAPVASRLGRLLDSHLGFEFGKEPHGEGASTGDAPASRAPAGYCRSALGREGQPCRGGGCVCDHMRLAACAYWYRLMVWGGMAGAAQAAAVAIAARRPGRWRWQRWRAHGVAWAYRRCWSRRRKFGNFHCQAPRSAGKARCRWRSSHVPTWRRRSAEPLAHGVWIGWQASVGVPEPWWPRSGSRARAGLCSDPRPQTTVQCLNYVQVGLGQAGLAASASPSCHVCKANTVYECVGELGSEHACRAFVSLAEQGESRQPAPRISPLPPPRSRAEDVTGPNESNLVPINTAGKGQLLQSEGRVAAPARRLS